jgi:SMC interacting uncharacterized protein involved in chromosome segregation
MMVMPWRTAQETTRAILSTVYGRYLSVLHPKPWPIILGVVVWLISIVLLFHRAVKSRKKPEILDVNQATPAGS